MADTTATPRSEHTRGATDRRLMQVTLQIAVGRGISGVTVGGVARRFGVARTAIYHRCHNASELLHEVNAIYLAIPDPNPVSSPTREHFMQLLQRLVDWVRDNDIDVKHVGIVLPSGAGFFQRIVDRVVTPWLERVGTFLRQGVAQDMFCESVDEKSLLSTITGSLMAYETIEGKTMDDNIAWVSCMANLLWPVLLK